jgi:hypothetical protein
MVLKLHSNSEIIFAKEVETSLVSSKQHVLPVDHCVALFTGLHYTVQLLATILQWFASW